MNETITRDGQEYEVLPLDRINEITHAKLAGGKVIHCDVKTPAVMEPYITMRRTHATKETFGLSDMADFGIQPLKLLPKVPVEFVATFAKSGTDWYPLHRLSDGLAHQNSATKRFRCVEVTE